MKKPAVIALAAVGAIALGGIVYAASSNSGGDRKAAIGATTTPTATGTTSPPSGSDPAGTVILGSSATSYAQPVTLIGATTNSLIYSDGANIDYVPQAGGAMTRLAPLDTATALPPNGNELVLQSANGNQTLEDFSTTPPKSSPLSSSIPQAAATYPTGLIYLKVDTANNQTIVYRMSTVGSNPNSIIGTITKRQITKPQVFATGAGVAVLDYTTTPTTGTFFSYTSTTPRTLNLGPAVAAGGTLTCYSMTSANSTVGGSTALGCSVVSTNGTQSMLRIPVDGTLPIATAAGSIKTVAVTPTSTAWLDDSNRLSQVPASGGQPVVANNTYSGLVANPLGKLFAYTAPSEPLTTAGIYSFATVTATPVKVLAAVAQPYQAKSITLTSGHVTWSANTNTNPAELDVWDSSVSVASGAVTAGTATMSNYQEGAKGNNISSSGARIVIGDGGGLRLSDGKTVASYDTNSTRNPQISGTRVLARDSSTLLSLPLNGTPAATDLTSLGIANNTTGSALWGNYLAYVKTDGTLLRKDLTSTATPVKLDSNLPTTTSVYAWGDWVGYCTPASASTSPCFLRNAKTTAASIRLSIGSQTILGLTSDGMLVGYPGDGSGFRLFRYPASTTLGTAIALTGVVGSSVSVDNSMVAWIGEDGRPRVAPAPSVANVSRSLGNALTLTPFKTTSTLWLFELDTSAPLTSCSVQIKSGTTLVRTISCSPAYLGFGSVHSSWDGKNASGVAQPAGTYSWTVVANNAAGALLAPDGSTAAVSGTFTRS